MTVTLTAEQEKFITEQVSSGHFRSAAEVVAQGLGMMRAQEEFIRTNVSALREQLGDGMEQIRRGETVDGKSALQDLREKLHRRARGER